MLPRGVGEFLGQTRNCSHLDLEHLCDIGRDLALSGWQPRCFDTVRSGGSRQPMEVDMIAECPKPSVNRLEEIVWLVDAEYREMPGMHLTFDQARRLFGLSAADCRRVLDHLVGVGMLMEDAGHRFCRRADSAY
jgi:hypothetical protein